jgi:hypothetical protein
MLIKIDQDIIDKCTKFAEECVGTNKYYASRGQANTSKITQDIITGKLGEFAAYELLKEKFEDTSLPDLEVYRGGKKSHSADLVAGGHKFSVKTQSIESVKKYGMSWLLEKNSLDKFTGHHVILCMEIEKGLILIQNVVPFQCVLDVMSEPRLKHLKSKCAFYYNDVILKGIV